MANVQNTATKVPTAMARLSFAEARPGVKVGQSIGRVDDDYMHSSFRDLLENNSVKVREVLGAYGSADEAARAAKELSRWNGGRQVAVVATQRPGRFGGYDYTVVTLDEKIDEQNFSRYHDQKGDRSQLTAVYSQGGKISYDIPDTVSDNQAVAVPWPDPVEKLPGGWPEPTGPGGFEPYGPDEPVGGGAFDELPPPPPGGDVYGPGTTPWPYEDPYYGHEQSFPSESWPTSPYENAIAGARQNNAVPAYRSVRE